VAAKKMEQTMIKQQPEEEIWVEIPICEYDVTQNVMGTMNEEEGKDNNNDTRNSEMQSRESNREEDITTTTRRGRKVRKPKRMIKE
jgi:hypothetical protein